MNTLNNFLKNNRFMDNIVIILPNDSVVIHHSYKGLKNEHYSILRTLRESYLSTKKADKCLILHLLESDIFTESLASEDVLERHKDFLTEDQIKQLTPFVFESEDGCKMHHGDTYYHVTPDFKEIQEQTVILSGQEEYLKGNIKRFSSKSNAEDYMLRNRPCLSIDEVMDLLEGNPKLEGSEADWVYNKTTKRVIDKFKYYVNFIKK